jgi:HK97 family phage portal protein
MIRELITATRLAVENRMSIADMDSILDMMVAGGTPSYTGKLVNQKSALGIPAVYTCVSILADDFATMGLIPYRWTDPGKAREQARDHYLWPLLTEEANPRMSAFEFLQAMETWRNLWGNCFAEIEINGRGQVQALWPWRADRVQIILENPADPRSPVWYAYRPMDAAQAPIVAPADRILHIRNLSVDGVTGLSPIEVHRQTMGLMMAQTESAARFYGNGMQVKGSLEHPGKLTKTAEANLRESMKAYTGLQNSHRLLILEEGMKYKEVGMKMEDAQFIQQMEYNGEDVCRIFKVPQHKAGYLDRATNNNVEQMAIDYVGTTQLPIQTNWAGRIHVWLLSQRDRRTVFTEPNYLKLMMADHTARAAYYNAMKWALAVDEIRQREGYNPLPDGLGELPRVPLNTAPIDSEVAKTGNQTTPAGDPEKAGGVDNV